MQRRGRFGSGRVEEAVAEESLPYRRIVTGETWRKGEWVSGGRKGETEREAVGERHESKSNVKREGRKGREMSGVSHFLRRPPVWLLSILRENRRI